MYNNNGPHNLLEMAIYGFKGAMQSYVIVETRRPWNKYNRQYDSLYPTLIILLHRQVPCKAICLLTAVFKERWLNAQLRLCKLRRESSINTYRRWQEHLSAPHGVQIRPPEVSHCGQKVECHCVEVEVCC